MTCVSRMALAIAAIGALGACGGAPDRPANEAAATNESAAVSDPFAEAEAMMSEAMMAAVGVDAGDSWARKMIAHHQGAIDMSEILLRQGPPAEVAEMAGMTIEKQRKDIADIEKRLKQGAPDPASAELYRPAMMDMQSKMRSATGADAAETYMRKMLEHHRGAVAMSDVALRNGVGGALRAQVMKTRDENEKDAKMIETMLRGESMLHAMAGSGAKSAEEAGAEPAAADKPRTRPSSPSPAPSPAPKPAGPAEPADPHAGHDMNAMN